VSLASWVRAIGDRKKLSRAIADYPVYSPPHSLEWPRDSFREAEDNFKYFLDNKDKRLSEFISWLSIFAVDAPLTIGGLASLDVWFHTFGPNLVHSEVVDTQALSDFYPRWDGDLRHLNVLWDLGTYFGEMICRKNEKAFWCIGIRDYSAAKRKMPDYFRPCIQLNTPRRPHDILDASERVLELAIRKKDFQSRRVPTGISLHYAQPNTLREEVREWAS
jgi:hypothetical protein